MVPLHTADEGGSEKSVKLLLKNLNLSCGAAVGIKTQTI
jgi:hypothetical protein